MWMTIGLNSKYNDGYKFTKKQTNQVRQPGGRYYITGVEYNDFPISFLPETSIVTMEEEGNTLKGTAQGIVSYNWFSGSGIVPQIGDFVSSGAVDYRIIGLRDMTKYPGAGIYFMYLRRDELAY